MSYIWHFHFITNIVFMVGGKNNELSNALYINFILQLTVQCTIISKTIWVKFIN